MSKKTVGIIANPASGKDIRRLVAHGTVFDNQEKVNIVRRILLGCDAVGIERVLYMPDYYGIIPQALDGLKKHSYRLSIECLPMESTGQQADSATAATLMRKLGAGCIVVMGGDGTSRQVAMGCGEVPIISLSTGTNNVFPTMMEGTVAGMAAGITALGAISKKSLWRSKKLYVEKNGKDVDIALVDAVMMRDQFIGARAIWEIENITQAVFTRGEPHNIGIAAILGHYRPLSPSDPYAVSLCFDPAKQTVFAPIAPGLFRSVGIAKHHKIKAGESVAIEQTPCIVALDGEREVEFGSADKGSIRMELDGPLVVNMPKAMKEGVRQGIFADKASLARFCGDQE